MFTFGVFLTTVTMCLMLVSFPPVKATAYIYTQMIALAAFAQAEQTQGSQLEPEVDIVPQAEQAEQEGGD